MAKSSRQRENVYQSADDVFTRFIPGYAREERIEQCFGGISGLSNASGAALGRRIVKEFTETTRSSTQQIAAADRHPARKAAKGTEAIKDRR